MLFHERKLAYPEWDWKPGPENQLWTHPTPGNDGSAECELHWLLYALVSILKPRIAFESGCCHGFSSYWMAKAIHDNGTGEFITCDVNRAYAKETDDRLSEFRAYYTVYVCAASNVPEIEFADFFFCDSNYGDRAEELRLLKKGAIALVHDTNEYARQWANGAPDLREALDKFTERIYFPATLRGFALVRKT
jgi:predicted O-methyltransferase YrrM